MRPAAPTFKLALASFVLASAFTLAVPARAEDPTHPTHPTHAPRVTATEALSRLKAGNQRFVEGRLAPKDFAAQRKALVKAQHPYAIILGCSDSRVPPSLIFDESLGQLFEIRLAGEIVEDQVEASVEYAAEHLDVPLIVVLGHDSCGAVQVALGKGQPHSSHQRNMVRYIQPALKRAQSLKGESQVAAAVEAEVRLQVQEILRESRLLQHLAREGKVKVVGAIYHLESGKVEFLPSR